MRRLLSAVRWEATIQARHHFVKATVVAAVMWLGLALLIPWVRDASPGWIAPAFVLTNLQITSFYFAAALLLLERTQGVLAALSTTPARVTTYLWAKVVTLTTLGAAENSFVIGMTFGFDATWLWLWSGVVVLGIIYTMFGLAVASRHAGISTFLITSIGWISVLSLPVLGYYRVLPMWSIAWIPTAPGLVLLEAAYRPVSATAVVLAAVGSGIWCALAYRFARTRLLELMERAAA